MLFLRQTPLLLVVVVVSGKKTLDPQYATNITVYHVNSFAKGVVPLNMDTSDLAGDVFFDLHAVALPLECPSPYAWPGDCSNSELTSNDLVISKLRLEVDSRFGEYGRCNVCDDNGTDPFSRLPCEPDEYFCSCGPMGSHDSTGPSPSYACNSSRVGQENITEAFGQYGCDWDTYVAAPWRCWMTNIVQVTGGMWYSTPESGYCGDESGDDQSDDDSSDDSCSWRVVEVVKVVSKNCSDAQVFSAVEAHDATNCFDACPFYERYNTSSPCYVGCFYNTVLGPEGLLPDYGAAWTAVNGMSLAELEAAWDGPFSSDDPSRGGCPTYDGTNPYIVDDNHHRDGALHRGAQNLGLGAVWDRLASISGTPRGNSLVRGLH